MDDDEWARFHELVNMSTRELRDWLGTEVAERAGTGVDAGPLADRDDVELGRQVLAILGKRRSDLTNEDVEVIHHVGARIARLRSELPPEPVAGSDRRRHRLMALGHDPLLAR